MYTRTGELCQEACMVQVQQVPGELGMKDEFEETELCVEMYFMGILNLLNGS